MISEQDEQGRSHRPMPRGVRRALNAMHANLGQLWALGELAAIAGVSARTLQRQFQSFVGKSPQAALRDVGFERARRELLQGGPGLRVTDVALRCGFAHPGRFAVGYRRRYGETPSQTLKRQTLFVSRLSGTAPLPARDRPTVAFDGIEASADRSEIAAMISEDLVVALNRSGLNVTIQARAARYRLHGAIRGEGSAGRLVLRLLDQDGIRTLWAQRIEGVLLPEVDGHDQLATRIVAALQPNLRHAEIDRALAKPDLDLTAHDLALRAMPGVLTLSGDGNARALELLGKAIDSDPDHGLATAMAAWAHAQRVVYHFSSKPEADRGRGLALARKVGTEAADSTVLSVLGNALTLLDELGPAEQVVRRALAVDGGAAWAWSRCGWLDVYQGDPQSAIERFRIALDLAPQDTLAFNSMVGIGCAYFKAGNYVEAARWQQRALLDHPSAVWVHRTMCPAYMLAGAKSEAGRSLQALRAHYPDLTVSEVQRGMPPLPDSYRHLVFEALSDAGLPD